MDHYKQCIRFEAAHCAIWGFTWADISSHYHLKQVFIANDFQAKIISASPPLHPTYRRISIAKITSGTLNFAEMQSLGYG